MLRDTMGLVSVWHAGRQYGTGGRCVACWEIMAGEWYLHAPPGMGITAVSSSLYELAWHALGAQMCRASCIPVARLVSAIMQCCRVIELEAA